MKGTLWTGVSKTVLVQIYILNTNTYTIATTVIPSLSYVVKDNSLTNSFTAFTPSNVALTIIYWLENSDGTAYDSSIFTFADGTSATSMTIYTTDNAKVGTYSMKIKAKFTTNTNVVVDSTFTVTILNGCTSTTMSYKPLISTITY